MKMNWGNWGNANFITAPTVPSVSAAVLERAISDAISMTITTTEVPGVPGVPGASRLAPGFGPGPPLIPPVDELAPGESVIPSGDEKRKTPLLLLAIAGLYLIFKKQEK